ncbi:Protein kinase A anchor protein, nuclear localization signal domain-containing protein, partial [Cynara cardunculus var. scolymus]
VILLINHWLKYLGKKRRDSQLSNGGGEDNTDAGSIQSRTCSEFHNHISDIEISALLSVKDVNDGVNVEVGSQVKVYDGSSSGVLKSQDGRGGAEVGAKLAEPNIGPTTFLDKEESKAFEGSVSSTDKHLVSLEVGSSLLRFIKGKGHIFAAIEGSSPDSVARASERIQLIIDEVVKSSALDYSHFVSLPLALYPELVDQLVNFQSSILGMHDPNPDEVLDISSNKDTTDEEDRDQKVDEAPQVAVTLQAQKDGENVKVDVTNIRRVSYPPKSSATSASKSKTSTSSGSPAKARVLYAPVEVVGGEDRLLQACIACNGDEREAQEKTKTRNSDSFDARGIMEQFGSKEWGEYLIHEVHLSQRFVFDEDGYYHRCASIPLPQNPQAD